MAGVLFLIAIFMARRVILTRKVVPMLMVVSISQLLCVPRYHLVWKCSTCVGRFLPLAARGIIALFSGVLEVNIAVSASCGRYRVEPRTSLQVSLFEMWETGENQSEGITM